MSGIAGIIRFDNKNTDPDYQQDAEALLNHRGDCARLPVLNGLLMSFGSIPLAGSISAVVDADGLWAAYPLPTVLAQYAQTGLSAFNDWPGDFAIALWDTAAQTLVLARDPLGTKPLYYVYRPGRFVAFASEIKALLTIREVDIQPNEHKFREYLTWATDYVPYSAETFYKEIFSVLPGHSVQINARQVATIPYWRIDPKQFVGLNRAEDWSEQFRTVFTTAIDQRMHGKSTVGSHLSGGLDSSSVSCVAQSLLRQQGRPRLHTFTVDSGLASTNESVYVQSVVDQWQTQQHTVRPMADVLESVLNTHSLFDRPEQFIIPSSFHLSVSLEAQKTGCDIILTGHDGDSVTSTGLDWLTALLNQDDWQAFAEVAHAYFTYRSSAAESLRPSITQQNRFEHYVTDRLFSKLKEQWRERAFQRIWKTILAQRYSRLSTAGVLASVARRIRARFVQQQLIDSAFSEDFKKRVALRPTLTTGGLATTWQQETPNGLLTVPVQQILNTTNVLCNEQLNHIGAHYGHTYSFPFFDKHVVELCLATPLELSFDKGRGRGLLRNGLQATLPTVIVERYTKANFVEYGTLATKQLYKATQEHWSSASHPIWGVIDPVVLREIVAIVFNDRLTIPKTRYNWLLCRVIYLALWLDSIPIRRSAANKLMP